MSSVEKLTISVGQALLLLMEKYSKDLNFFYELKQLYLSGAKDTESLKRIEVVLQDDSLKQYKVSRDPKIIDSDPTRRYFETHLAFESLKNSITVLSKKSLENHYQHLYDSVTKELWQSTEDAAKDELDSVLNGTFDAKKNPDEIAYREYNDCIKRLDTDNNYKVFSKEDREKIKILMKCIMLSVNFVSAKDRELPLNIYEKGIYSTEQRGAKKRIGQDENLFNSQTMGIMKASMPLPQKDIALTEQTIGFLRSADRTTFYARAEWVKRNFEMLVHPFSNSISGTMLCQLRMLLYFQDLGKLEFTDAKEISNLLKCITSGLLYSTGGHTLIEFVSPMSLPEVQTAFSFIKDFETMNLAVLFFEKNDAAFNAALQKTMDYNNIILKRMGVLKSIPERWATQLGQAVSLTSAVEASKYYLGELSSIDTKRIENNRVFIARNGINYVMAYKDENGDIKSVPIVARASTTKIPGGFDLLGTNVILTSPDDFDAGLENIGRDRKLILLNYLELLPKSVQKFLKTLKAKGENLETAVNPALLSAVLAQDLDLVKWLLKGKVDVNTKNGKGDTVLLVAASRGNLELVKFLVEHGANVNAENNAGDTALLLLLLKRNWDAAKFLVEHGANVNARNDKDDNIALLLVAARGPLELIKLFVRNGANINSTDKQGLTAFLWLLITGNLEAAKWFLEECKVDVNAADREGNTPLLFAVEIGNVDFVKELVKRGANINAKTKWGDTVLESVARQRKWDVVEYLIKQPTLNLDVNGPNARALKIPEVAKLIEQRKVSEPTEMTPQTTLIFSEGGSGSTTKTEDTTESTKKKGPTTEFK